MKNLTTVLSAEHARLVDDVKGFHAGCLTSAKAEMVYRFLTGCRLIKLKEITVHGDWENFRKEHFPEIPSQTASLYSRTAKAVLELKSPTVGDLKVEQLQIENGRLPEKQEAKVLEVLREVYDGKSQTEFYRSVGLIREKKLPKHTPARALTADEKLTAEREAEDALYNTATGALMELCAEERVFNGKASPGKAKELLSWTRAFGKLMKTKSKAKALKKGGK